MSGIVGSRLNIRGSGLVGSVGSDGQILTSSGAGESHVFEDAAGGGKIGQVVSAITTDGTSTTSTTFTSLGLAVSITPVATSSKILLFANMTQVTNTTSGEGTKFKFDGGNTSTYIGDAGTGFEVAAGQYNKQNNTGTEPVCMQYLDSPSSTSEVTYTVHWHCTNYTSYNNRPGSQAAATMNSVSTITAMEVLA